MKSIFVFLAFGLSCIVASAQTFGLHLASTHFPEHKGDNNQNLGAYVRLESGLTFGGYRNTIERNSFYVGQTFEVGPFELVGGVISGYQKKGGKGHSRGFLSLLGAVSIALPAVAGVTPRVTFAPGQLVKTQNVLHLSIERGF